ncbi:hypothetical protein HYX13_05855 [Candidatus Woesearchaeota archaeon]|nr:hypothetical protein [Candidatus Woesearchaeota archaeon]
MENKKIFTSRVLFSSLLLLVFLSASFVLAQEPPSLENHQFYGRVTWNAVEARPQQVVAKVGTAEFSTSIKDAACSAVTNSCSATYGQSPDTLRVQGRSGDLILFFVDGRKAGNDTYRADAATELNLDLRTLAPIANDSGNLSSNVTNGTQTCLSNLNCTTWSVCSNNNQTRSCTDLNACNTSRVTFNQSQSCISGTGATAVCEQHWQCTAWSGCVDDERTRTCERDDDCDAKLTAKEVASIRSVLMPSESESCVSVAPPPSPPPPVQPLATCFDNIKNQNEEKVDCGGMCKACLSEKVTEEKKGLPWYLYAGIGLVVALGILAAVYFFVIKGGGGEALAPEKAGQLRNFFQRSLQQGLSKEQVISKLVQSGWEEKVVKKFLRKENL